MCVQGGCSEDEDCVVYGLTCNPVDGVNRCVQLCNSDAYCTAVTNTPGTRCIGVTDESDNYCVEDLS